MSDYVAINVLTVPAEMGAHLEERFGARAGMADNPDSPYHAGHDWEVEGSWISG